MTDMDPSKVKSRQDFVEFVSLLKDDFKLSESNWENVTVESFLEALSAYSNDVDGYYKNMKIDVDADAPSWRVFADILRGASIYE